MEPNAEVRVDPDTLRAGARACNDLAESIGQSLSDVESETWAAYDALPAWRTQQALKAVQWWWIDDLSRLSSRLGATGSALDACARDYDNTDHTSATHFVEAQGQW